MPYGDNPETDKLRLVEASAVTGFWDRHFGGRGADSTHAEEIVENTRYKIYLGACNLLINGTLHTKDIRERAYHLNVKIQVREIRLFLELYHDKRDPVRMAISTIEKFLVEYALQTPYRSMNRYTAQNGILSLNNFNSAAKRDDIGGLALSEPQLSFLPDQIERDEVKRLHELEERQFKEAIAKFESDGMSKEWILEHYPQIRHLLLPYFGMEEANTPAQGYLPPASMPPSFSNPAPWGTSTYPAAFTSNPGGFSPPMGGPNTPPFGLPQTPGAPPPPPGMGSTSPSAPAGMPGTPSAPSAYLANTPPPPPPPPNMAGAPPYVPPGVERTMPAANGPGAFLSFQAYTDSPPPSISDAATLPASAPPQAKRNSSLAVSFLFTPLSEQDASKCHRHAAYQITSVERSGLGDRAGLQSGWYLLGINGTPLNNLDEIDNILFPADKPIEQATLQVYANGQVTERILRL